MVPARASGSFRALGEGSGWDLIARPAAAPAAASANLKYNRSKKKKFSEFTGIASSSSALPHRLILVRSRVRSLKIDGVMADSNIDLAEYENIEHS